MTIEVLEAGTDDERVIFGMLQTAKHICETPEEHGGVQPMAFMMCGDRSLAIIGLGKLGDWNEGSVRDEAAVFLRLLAKDRNATIVAILGDAWVYRFTPEVANAARAAGLDTGQFKAWSQDDRERFPFTRREALSLAVETRTGAKMIYQFYRRDRSGTIRWMECEIESEDNEIKVRGRFANLLPLGD